ncbi:hypothetical protein [Actomonas aquatica]|uniref:Glycosyltransferase RgtA/B/C/D-like domain-containing protein n=1 Tax=Actomonas aquatica TaxID=2866162 RepID=A0ABZ1C202_9BACT|nr:hypothetical protein [Opitutus sp. WL0086]WRQ85692.1 hypothetical protein K1X11_012840 [Opitutus sp. WL0086]
MKDLFHWLDLHPVFYTTAGGCALAAMLVVWAAVGLRTPDAAGEPRRWRRSGLAWLGWAGGFTLLLFAWRWPLLLDSFPLNPDEAGFVASAMKVLHDPVFFRSIDNTTSGPLASLPLALAFALGLPADYFTARFVAILLVAGALAFSTQAMRRLAGPRATVIGLLPAWLLFTLGQDWDFTHYSSEVLPLFLMGLVVWGVVRAADRGFGGMIWGVAGFSLGCLPWAKLQSAPIALTLGLWATGWTLFRPDRSWTQRGRSVGLLALATIAPTALLLAGYALSGELNNWWQAYVLNNIIYAGGIPGDTGVENILKSASYTYNLHSFLFVSVALVSIGLSWTRHPHRQPGFWLGALTTVSSAYAIMVPGRGFQHYALFFILPTAWLSCALLGHWLDRSTAPRRNALALLSLVCVVAALPIITRASHLYPPELGQALNNWRFPHTQIAEVLRHLRQPQDTLSVWGWDPNLYVQSGLPPATRDVHTERHINKHPMREGFYLALYLQELQRYQPAFFVDAVGANAFQFSNRREEGHETVPIVRDYIAANYTYVGDFSPWRLYLRKDRAADRSAVLDALAYSVRRLPPLADQPRPEVQIGLLPNVPRRNVEGKEVSIMEPPLSIDLFLQGNEQSVIFEYGYDPRAYERDDQGDGSTFVLSIRYPDGFVREFWRHHLDPSHLPRHRGRQESEVPLPLIPSGCHLVVQTTRGPYGDGAWDWPWVANFRFRRGPLISAEFIDFSQR